MDPDRVVAAPLRVLFVGMHWDYGIESRGPSFEHLNFFDSMRHMAGVEVWEYDFMSDFQRGGQDAVATGLRAAVAQRRPDVAFFMLYEDQIPFDILTELRDDPKVLTINWFCDDHWRFESFTRVYAPYFDVVTTTDVASIPKYRSIGIEPILTQWAANPNLYHPTGKPPRLDVSFVGQAYGDRPWSVRRLRKAGIDVSCWGPMWPDGRLEFDEMVATFAESRINLNLTAASNDPRVPRYVRGVLNRTYPPLLQRLGRGLDQIKGRTYEIPACGGFQLSSRALGIESQFEPGREIVLFDSAAEMVELAKRYLANERERAAIAAAGHERVLRDHTYVHRFSAIFSELGLVT